MEKYLVCWKEFTAEHDTWEKEEDLENARKAVDEFEESINAEVRKQEKLDKVEKKNCRRGELPGKYIVKILYG